MISRRLVIIIIVVYTLYTGLYSKQITDKLININPLLFTPSNSLSTVTPNYKSCASKVQSVEVETKPKENFEFVNYVNKFDIDDSDQISKNNNTYCLPSNFGYSIETGESVFPKYIYPRCDTMVKNSPILNFDYEKNEFSMSCQKGSPHYVLEPSTKKGRLYLYDEILSLFKVEKYTTPVKLNEQEFVLGSCDGSTFSNAVYTPRFKPEVFTETNKTIHKLGLKHKPLIVLMLTVDSYSRRHFFRKMTKTVEFLNSLNSSFPAFDYKLHNIYGASTVANIAPILSGNKHSDEQTYYSEDPREYDAIEKDSMWGFFKSKGFVTLFGLEDCDHDFPNSIGRFPKVDHIMRSFFCAGRKFSKISNDIDSSSAPRCIGPQMSHFYALDYIFKFSEFYFSLNQWVYIHINSGHEPSGQHAQTLDVDMVEFLQKYLKTFGQNHEIAIFLHGDHGMRYGNWYKDVEAYQENKLPVFFFIGSKSLLDRIPRSYYYLQENTVRFTTKKDLRPTINYLAEMPYFTPNSTENSKFVNLFANKAPLNRSCEDLNISPFDCSCLVVEELFNITDDKDLYQLALTVIEEALYKINYGVHTPYIGQYNICKKLTFNKILNVYGMMLNNKVEELQLKFSVNESPSAVFEAFAFVGTHARSEVLIASGYRGPVTNYVYRGYRTRIKIFGIKRKDKYAGPCEDYTRSLDLRSEFCICEDNSLNSK